MFLHVIEASKYLNANDVMLSRPTFTRVDTSFVKENEKNVLEKKHVDLN